MQKQTKSGKRSCTIYAEMAHDLVRFAFAPVLYFVVVLKSSPQTDKGVIMVTSLANFRSDFTVVHIPDGDFLAHRERLFVNINLLRMGCSGRSALTLQEPRSVRIFIITLRLPTG